MKAARAALMLVHNSIALLNNLFEFSIELYRVAHSSKHKLKILPEYSTEQSNVPQGAHPGAALHAAAHAARGGHTPRQGIPSRLGGHLVVSGTDYRVAHLVKILEKEPDS